MSLPFEITDVPSEINRELMSLFSGHKDGYVRVGPNKYLLPFEYGKQADGYYNMELRSDYVWIITYPRSGTTWTQELVWLINNDLDYEKAKEIKLVDRNLYLESSILTCDKYKKEIIEKNNMDEKRAEDYLYSLRPGYEKAKTMKSPRQIKTHFPLNLLPPKLLDTCKVIYVARNPKDVAVSFYYLSRLLTEFGFQGDFKKYWDLFQKDLIFWTPFWDHVEEAWKQQNHPNLLFLFYEDMKKDLKSSIQRVAAFFNKSLNEDEVSKLADHLSFENFHKNPALQQLSYNVKGVLNDGEKGFFRKGTSGGWRSEFSSEMNEKADKWIEENEKRTNIIFQY